MEKPKCKICGERHYGMCHPMLSSLSFGETKEYRASQDKLINDIGRRLADDKAKNVPVKETLASMGVAVSDVFDRVAYQREYMRKRRAKAKNASS